MKNKIVEKKSYRISNLLEPGTPCTEEEISGRIHSSCETEEGNIVEVETLFRIKIQNPG